MSKHPEIPQEYAARLRQAQAARAMRGERRVITALFCDVTGSTAIAGQLDPEEWAEIMNEAFGYMIAPIYEYEGTIARLLGDGLLAFFGAPIAHEDDPQRAILAGLSIIQGIADFRRTIEQEYGSGFDVRVGINTGPVVVGDIGADLYVEYTAMGDAINLASRMESTAVPGTVQIAPATYELVRPLFEFEERGLLQIKGKSEPLPAYQVLRARNQPGSLRGFQGIETPLAGRRAELATLQEAAAALDDGHGRIVFLIGEAGLGKSRLIAELHRWWAANRPPAGGWDHWAQLSAVSYGATRPYGVLIAQLRQTFDIHEADSPAQVRAKLAAIAEFYPHAFGDRMQRLFGLLLGAAAADDPLRPEGEDFQRELFDVLQEFTRRQVDGRPTVYVAEDYHWADPASVAEIEHMVQLVHELPALFVIALRPDRETPGWAARGRIVDRYTNLVSEIPLRPLDDRDSAALIDGLLAMDDLPAAVRFQVLRQTDGNPFFIEEVLRALFDQGALQLDGSRLRWRGAQDAAQLQIPGNVQALLAARIDRLDRDAKHTLQLASVIGRSFYERVLESIHETAVGLDEQLADLEALALIQEESRQPEFAYAFRHALTRDATYETILFRQRREFHRRVAAAYEDLFPDRLAEEAQQLAYHFAEGRQFDRALHYYRLAGDHAAALFANAEAAGHYRQAIALAEQQGASDDLPGLYAALGRILEVTGQYEQAVALYRRARAPGTPPALLAQSLLAEATIRGTYTDLHDPAQAQMLLQQALALFPKLDDPRLESRIYWNLLLLGTFSGVGRDQAIAYGERAADIARQHDLREELGFALHDLARPYTAAGRIEDAWASLAEAAVIWRELGKMAMLTDNLSTRAAGLGLVGRLEESIAVGTEALELSRRIHSRWGQSYAQLTLAPQLFESGRFDEGLAAWRDALDAGVEGGSSGPQVFARMNLALVLGELGALAEARRYAADAEQRAEHLHGTLLGVYPRLLQARLDLLEGKIAGARAALPAQFDLVAHLQIDPIAFSLTVASLCALEMTEGHFEEALNVARQAAATCEQAGLALSLLKLRRLEAEALIGLGRAAEARPILLQLESQAREFNARHTLLLLLAARARAASALGLEAEAGEMRTAVFELIDVLAQSLSDPALRESFARTPQRLLDEGATY